MGSDFKQEDLYSIVLCGNAMVDLGLGSMKGPAFYYYESVVINILASATPLTFRTVLVRTSCYQACSQPCVQL